MNNYAPPTPLSSHLTFKAPYVLIVEKKYFKALMEYLYSVCTIRQLYQQPNVKQAYLEVVILIWPDPGRFNQAQSRYTATPLTSAR